MSNIFAKLTLPNIIVGMLFAMTSQNTLAGSDNYAENNSWQNDSWHLEYEYDDFSDKIHSAKLIYAPQNYGPEKAFLLRCQPYYTNFSVAFLAPQKDIMENGEFHNNAERFEKHGFLYSEERNIKFKVNGEKYSDDVEVGGQVRGISQWIGAAKKDLPNDSLQLNLFSTLVYNDIPSFLGKQNTDLSEKLYTALKTALQQETVIQFTLEMPNGIDHKFSLDGKRLKSFAPPEVLDFCLLKRTLRDD
ncbi:conserved exported hypothetical protein [uncultured Thiomicrorhabdus sp.]